MGKAVEITTGSEWHAKHDKRIRVRVILPHVDIRHGGRIKCAGVLYLRTDQDEAPTVRRTTEFAAQFVPL